MDEHVAFAISKLAQLLNERSVHLDKAVEAVQATDTIVYGICYESGFPGCDFLKAMADPTGGRMFQAGKKIPLAAIFQTIEQELRSQYALGYVPVKQERGDVFRKLEVRVRMKGLKVRARKGYYADQRVWGFWIVDEAVVRTALPGK